MSSESGKTGGGAQVAAPQLAVELTGLNPVKLVKMSLDLGTGKKNC